MFAIQYLGFARSPIYLTPQDSLAIFAANSSYYLVNTLVLESVLGRWNKAQAPQGPEPEARLNQASCLWRSADQASNLTDLQQLQAYKLPLVERLYEEVVKRCSGFNKDSLPAIFLASELHTVIPRPQAPEPGFALGESRSNSNAIISADPPTRHRIKKKKATNDAADTDQDEANPVKDSTE